MPKVFLRKQTSPLVLALLVAACTHGTPAPSPAADHIVISEILAGVPGDNNLEFIELYNPLLEPVDLHAWRLTYRIPSSASDLPVFAWDRSTVLPAHGHFLLVRQGEDVGEPADATFDQPLNTISGALALKAPDGTPIDAVAWGQGVPSMTEGQAAAGLANGQSLERRPGANMGNGSDTQDNRGDFFLNASPNPQDTGSPVAPALPQGLQLSLTAPASVQPGAEVGLELQLTNTGQSAVSGVAVTTWLPPSFSAPHLPAGTSVDGGRLTWTVSRLTPGDSQSVSLSLTAPWSRGSFAILNPMATSPICATAFASPCGSPSRTDRSRLGGAKIAQPSRHRRGRRHHHHRRPLRRFREHQVLHVRPQRRCSSLGARRRIRSRRPAWRQGSGPWHPQDYRGTVELVADSSSDRSRSSPRMPRQPPRKQVSARHSNRPTSWPGISFALKGN